MSGGEVSIWEQELVAEIAALARRQIELEHRLAALIRERQAPKESA